MRRWLARAGLVAGDPAIEPIGQLPWPGDVDKTTWLSEMRRYLGVAPGHMDELIDAPQGTWEAVEQDGQDLGIEQIRALLRRVPHARRMYLEVATYYPELLTRSGIAAYPEGYSDIGKYIRALRTESELSEEDLAPLVDKSRSTVINWEIGTTWPPRPAVEIISEVAPFTHNASYDELAECFTYLPRKNLVFPAFRAVESFGEYLNYFIRLNNVKDAEVARTFGLTRPNVGRYKKGQEIDELAMLQIYHDALQEQELDSWNELAEAWGHRYRIGPAGETIPDASLYETVHGVHDWLTAIRLYYRMNQSEFASLIGVTKGTVSQREIRSRPSVVALRELRDTLQDADVPLPGEPFSNDTLVKALQQFYATPDTPSRDDEDNRLFWRLIATRPGSPEEREIRHQILEKYAWIAEAAITYWSVPETERSDLLHYAIEAIGAATRTFVPPGNFISAALVNARHAMTLAYYKHMYPNFGSKDRQRIVAVDTLIRKLTNNAGVTDDRFDVEISQALGLGLTEVREARERIPQRKPLFLEPLTSDEDNTDTYEDEAQNAPMTDAVAPTAAAAASAQETFSNSPKIREALPNLSAKERRVVLSYLIEEISLAEMCTELDIGPEAAQNLVTRATESLRSAYTDEPDNEPPATPDQRTPRQQPGDDGPVSGTSGPARRRPAGPGTPHRHAGTPHRQLTGGIGPAEFDPFARYRRDEADGAPGPHGRRRRRSGARNPEHDGTAPNPSVAPTAGASTESTAPQPATAQPDEMPGTGSPTPQPAPSPDTASLPPPSRSCWTGSTTSATGSIPREQRPRSSSNTRAIS